MSEPTSFEVTDKNGDSHTYQGTTMGVDSQGTLSIVTNKDGVVCAYGAGQWIRAYKTGHRVEAPPQEPNRTVR